MAVAGTRNAPFLESITAPVGKKPVPNHLLETKIFSKITQNNVIQAKPSVIHFGQFEIGKKYSVNLRLANISAECQRMHIIPPMNQAFGIKYQKRERLVPGLFLEVVVEFTPDEWKYYSDCLRIHCKDRENLVIPIHAFPVMDTSSFPKILDFPSVAVGQSKTKTIPLKNNVPVDFEFQLSLLQSHPSFTVEPMEGTIPGNSRVDIKVTFAPVEFATAHINLQLLVSQFNAEPLICKVTGHSAPGMYKREKLPDVSCEIPAVPSELNILDPQFLDPLSRSRLKKSAKRPWTPSDYVPKPIVHEGIRFPADLNNPSAVSSVLLQTAGKMKVKHVKEAMQSKTDANTANSKQMKEAVFEQLVNANVLEERQNQLRWCVRLGEDSITNQSRKQVTESQNQADLDYKLRRGDPVLEIEFNRSCTGCNLQRIHRSARKVPKEEPMFDLFVNDDWTKRHMILQKFIQAARKVMIRQRADTHLKSLSKFVEDWRRGKFSKGLTRSQMVDNEEEKLVSTPFTLNTDDVLLFSFPEYQSPDSKDDIEVGALGSLDIQTTTVNLRVHVPYFNLKVPQQYKVLGYSPHSVSLASVGYVSPSLPRPLRVGAEDELVNLVAPVTVSKITSKVGLELEDVEEDSHVETETKSVDTTEIETAPLVVPEAFFNPPAHHPLHIFNPAPGLQVFKPFLSHSEVDHDYNLQPLPRHRQLPAMSKSGKALKPFLSRQDVIPGVMVWKRFPSQTLVSLSSSPTLSNVWVPRWTDPFGDDLLPREGPPLLEYPPEDDPESDGENLDTQDDQKSEESGFLLPNPEMVTAQFAAAPKPATVKDSDVFPDSGRLPPGNNSTFDAGLISRSSRENDLEHFMSQRNNRLGGRVQLRIQSTASQLP